MWCSTTIRPILAGDYYVYRGERRGIDTCYYGPQPFGIHPTPRQDWRWWTSPHPLCWWTGEGKPPHPSPDDIQAMEEQYQLDRMSKRANQYTP